MRFLKSIVFGTQSVLREKNKDKHRHPLWPAARKLHLQQNPSCAVCGTSNYLQVHHVVPFNEDPTLELEPTNLMTLCAFNLCHLEIGHGDNFKFFNPRLIPLLEVFKEGIINKDILILSSKSVRLKNDGIKD